VEPQRWVPDGHALPQAPPTHVADPPDGGVQLRHVGPQRVASLSGAHAAPQRWVPDGHALPQAPLVHVADPPDGIGQSRHVGPQL
jgi:hypothetical protein